MTRRDHVVLRAIALVLATASAGTAQTGAEAPAFRSWHPMLSIGGGLTGVESLGARTVETRAAALGTTTPPPFTLFRTESTLDRGGRGEAVIAVPITRTFSIDLVGTAARRTMTTAISADAEGAPSTSASQRISEYQIGARASLLLPGGWLGRRARPFATAGGAYLRQLHDEDVLVELLDGAKDADAVGVRQPVVEEHQVHAFLDLLEPALAGLGLEYLVALGLQPLRQGPANQRFIVNDENGGFRHVLGLRLPAGRGCTWCAACQPQDYARSRWAAALQPRKIPRSPENSAAWPAGRPLSLLASGCVLQQTVRRAW